MPKRSKKHLFIPAILSLILSLFFSSCLLKNESIAVNKETNGNEKPSWINTMQHQSYPKGKFILGIGFAAKTGDDPLKDQKTADSSSIRSIAEQIRVNIKGSATDIQTEKGGESTQSVEVMTNLTVNIEGLEGYSTVERFFDKTKNTYYSLSVLDIEKASNNLFKTISDLQRSADEYFESAESLLTQEEISKALQGYLKSLNQLREAMPQESLLTAISGRRNTGIDRSVTIPKIEGKIQGITSNIYVKKDNGDNQKGKISSPLKEPLIASFFLKKGGRDISITNFPVRFSFKNGGGTLQDETITHDNGTAICYVSNLIPSGVSINIIEAKLDFSKFTRDEERLIPVKTEFNYTLPTKHDVSVMVHIKETVLGKESKESSAEIELLKGLKDRDFHVVDKTTLLKNKEDLDIADIIKHVDDLCDIIIIGKIETIEKSEMGGLFFAESAGEIKIIDTKTKGIMKALKITPKQSKDDTGYDTKGGGLNMTVAAQNSITKTGKALAKDTAILIEEAFNAGFNNSK